MMKRYNVFLKLLLLVIAAVLPGCDRSRSTTLPDCHHIGPIEPSACGDFVAMWLHCNDSTEAWIGIYEFASGNVVHTITDVSEFGISAFGWAQDEPAVLYLRKDADTGQSMIARRKILSSNDAQSEMIAHVSGIVRSINQLGADSYGWMEDDTLYIRTNRSSPPKAKLQSVRGWTPLDAESLLIVYETSEGQLRAARTLIDTLPNTEGPAFILQYATPCASVAIRLSDDRRYAALFRDGVHVVDTTSMMLATVIEDLDPTFMVFLTGDTIAFFSVDVDTGELFLQSQSITTGDVEECQIPVTHRLREVHRGSSGRLLAVEQGQRLIEIDASSCEISVLLSLER